MEILIDTETHAYHVNAVFYFIPSITFMAMKTHKTATKSTIGVTQKNQVKDWSFKNHNLFIRLNEIFHCRINKRPYNFLQLQNI